MKKVIGICSGLRISVCALVVLSACAAHDRAWDAAVHENTVEAYSAYLQQHHTKTKHWREAYKAIAGLEWQEAQSKDTLEAYQDFLKKYDNYEMRKHAFAEVKAANAEIPRLTLEAISQHGDRSLLQSFIARWTYPPYNEAYPPEYYEDLVAKARAHIQADEDAWARALASGQVDDTTAYLNEFRLGKYAGAAREQLLMREAGALGSYCLRVTLSGDFRDGQEKEVVDTIRTLVEADQNKTVIPEEDCPTGVSPQLVFAAHAESQLNRYAGVGRLEGRDFELYNSVRVTGSLSLVWQGDEVQQTFDATTLPNTSLYGVPDSKSAPRTWSAHVIGEAEELEVWLHRWNAAVAGTNTVIERAIKTNSRCRPQYFDVTPVERALASLGPHVLPFLIEYPDHCLWVEPGHHYESPFRHIVVEVAKNSSDDARASFDLLASAVADSSRDKQLVLARAMADVDGQIRDLAENRLSPKASYARLLDFVWEADEQIADSAINAMCNSKDGRVRVADLSGQTDATSQLYGLTSLDCASLIRHWRASPDARPEITTSRQP